MLEFAGRDMTQQAFHRRQLCRLRSGYAGVEPNPQFLEQLSPDEDVFEDASSCGPEPSCSGQVRCRRVQPFRPRYVQLDKKVLKFKAYFRQDFHGSQYDTPCIRHVELVYYLEDDTLTIIEQLPHSNRPHHKWKRLLQRHRVPKHDTGVPLDWRDLNVQQNVVIYGITYHIYDANAGTRQFYESEGIELSEGELGVPRDQWTERRAMEKCMERRGRDGCTTEGGVAAPPSKCQRGDRYSSEAKLDNVSLKFSATLVSCQLYDRGRQFVISYYPYDDTVSIFECHIANSGIRGGKFLRRCKPEMAGSTEQEPRYYNLCHFLVGATLTVNKRCFCITGADRKVLAFIRQHLPSLQENVDNLQQHFSKLYPEQPSTIPVQPVPGTAEVQVQQPVPGTVEVPVLPDCQ